MSMPYRIWRDFKVPYGSSDQRLNAAADYVAKPGDVFLCSFPKCGTTWLQYVVFLLKNQGRPPTSTAEVLGAIPFPEQDGFPETSFMALKYHFPRRLMPWNPNAKYLYIARNPKDTCVSYYHFLRTLPGYESFKDNFDDFFEAFISGNLPHGDLLDHILEWFTDPLPVSLCLTYEGMQRHRSETISKIAEFLDMGTLPESTLQDVLEHSSFGSMSRLEQKDDTMERYLRGCTGQKESAMRGPEPPRMMRKGKVGDWRTQLTPQQALRMDQRIAMRVRGTVLETDWEGEIR